MPSKLQFYTQMADTTARQVTGSFGEWTAFLETMGRLYKYPFHEQLMIFAQKPNATACADYDLWNKQMDRYVRRGSKGIALLDTTGDNPRLKYVFDVSDTGGRENSRRLNLWEYKDEHHNSVTTDLENRFGVSGEKGLAEMGFHRKKIKYGIKHRACHAYKPRGISEKSGRPPEKKLGDGDGQNEQSGGFFGKTKISPEGVKGNDEKGNKIKQRIQSNFTHSEGAFHVIRRPFSLHRI